MKRRPVRTMVDGSVSRERALCDARKGRWCNSVYVVVEQAGLSQLVDHGRCGYGQYGLAGGQPMDSLAARTAHALLGGGAAHRPWWIEIGPAACRLRVTEPIMVALAGAVRSIGYGREYDSHRVDGGHSSGYDGGHIPEVGPKCARNLGRYSQIALQLEENQWLQIGASEDGFYTYLSFGAELELDGILGSVGASLVGDFPGILGRRLADGDRLAVAPTFVPTGESPSVTSLHPVANRQWLHRDSSPASDSLLRFVPGPDYGALLTAAPWALASGAWMTSSTLDRRAVRLQAKLAATPPVVSMSDGAARSVPTVHGLIQWPSGGWPLILGPDRQTIGGYPRFGCIATADLPQLGRLRPGRGVTLVPVSRQEARALYETTEQRVSKWLHWVRTASGR
ncbi:MAG: 5-oxoprolinase subunit C family protein [Bacilli bacterium]